MNVLAGGSVVPKNQLKLPQLRIAIPVFRFGRRAKVRASNLMPQGRVEEQYRQDFADLMSERPEG